MKTRSLEKIGVPSPLTPLAKQLVAEARAAGLGQVEVRRRLEAVLADPAAHRTDPHLGRLAEALATHASTAGTAPPAIPSCPASWRSWPGCRSTATRAASIGRR